MAATAGQWVAGARVRTLPNSVAPVIVGAGAAGAIGEFNWWASLLALVVSLALQVGVNYANDYSDGIRGTDDTRVGPLRLVASGVASASAVRLAAFVCFGVAGVAGLVLVALTGHWWLISIGVVSVAAAWFYTGGPRPYGYAGWGEVAVFAFFGPVAVLGTLYVQAGELTWPGAAGAVALGSISAGVLVANNLRDLPTDQTAGKITMAVRLGDRGTRVLYVALVAIPFVVSVLTAIAHPWLLLGLLAAVLVAPAVRTVTRGSDGMALIPVLRDTSLAMLAWAVLTGVALALS
ncbi:1,4-dihydroxy-2-naphthoate polyprenyltransferase [Actinophytocola algeriensis]|uniref:1,4-dihydroxy-2-naphthoate octaprenyltransferase n=1 Tax=Actinophytocola algeriensis TaxID=1768010 RepID=A0A7W7QDX8_9PSEU|nr:1,4-dihydroxy-2-naphthoate polyprenyltransferase [Actinophytocola algeriensis]MBB4911852.1 1,4-dihydroxy-2-naphthoate octaprenyltransferase [Actinophytocola algeriensis]MBE1477656.1 1,4-dihydroxy-2-naphthoate octaprenyltransferase [Actinophytocola algeriensis]